VKVLFIREKWGGPDPGYGPSDGDGMVRCFESLGLGEARFFYYDEWLAEHPGEKPDLAAFDAYWEFKPDLILFTHLLQLGERNISRETIKAFAHSKVVGVWHEGVAQDVVRVADGFADIVDCNLFLDTDDQFRKYSRDPDKCYGLYDPRDEKIWNDPGKARNLGVSFLGTLVSRQVRCSGIFTLLANGVPVTKLGGRREEFVAQDVYIDILQRSLMTINFSDAGEFRHYKGRVAEAALCGTMILDLVNPEMPKIMEPFVHYVPFSNEKELFDAVQHYGSHEEERATIAEAGKLRARELLDGRVFWQKLFEKVGLA
jgi:hypothetical protein